GLLEFVAAFVFAVDDLAVVDELIRDDLGVSYPSALVVLEHGEDLRKKSLPPHLVGCPHLAAHAAPHGILDAEVGGEEVGGAAHRGRAVPGAGLTENREVGSDGEVAGSAD